MFFFCETCVFVDWGNYTALGPVVGKKNVKNRVPALQTIEVMRCAKTNTRL